MIDWQRSYIHVRTGKRAATVRELFRDCTAEERRLSSAFLERYLAGRGSGGLTVISGVREGVGILDSARTAVGTASGDLYDRLAAELAGKASPVHVAVSGGIDSWLLVAILKSLGYDVRGWLLVSGIPGYCEREIALRMAAALDISCEEIHAGAEEFVSELEEFVAITETPIYNLHPVSKLLLARGLRRRGVASVVTGDGADQVMRRDWDCDLLPLTATCFRSQGVALVTPFLSGAVAAVCDRPHPDKRPVRELALRLGVPDLPKRPTLFPDLGLSRRDWLDRTTGLLMESLEARLSCAASPA